MRKENGLSWTDYRHLAPIHRQQYTIKREILSVETGLIGRTRRSFPLYMVESMQEHRNLLQRIINLTTIRFIMRDSNRTTIELINIFSDNGGTYERLMDEVSAAQRRLFMRMSVNPQPSSPYVQGQIPWSGGLHSDGDTFNV